MCGAALALWWRLAPEVRRFYADGETIRAPQKTTTPRDILWQPPARLSGMINSGEQDYEPRLSWDGSTLFFVRGKPGENADIFIASRTPEGWSEPTALGDLNSSYDDLGPAPSADGKTLYFYSDRPGGSGGYDLWRAQRGEARWQPPVNLGPAVNSDFNDYGAAVTPDGATLYFASNRPRGDEPAEGPPSAWPATLRENQRQRTYDIYASTLSDRGATPAAPVHALNTPHNEGAACVTPAGDFLYFASDRPGGAGGFDLYRARRLNGELQQPTPLGEGVNSPANELDPGLTALGFALFFSSDRPAERIDPLLPNVYNVYYTSAREVFSDEERVAAAPLNVVGLLKAIGPSLLWLLLALLLTLLLLVLMRDLRNRRLTLLARCLFASALTHALLLLAFTFWRVGNAIVGAIREGGGTQIVLHSPSQGDSLALQIRGELTQVDAPDSVASTLAPVAPSIAARIETLPATLSIPPSELPPNDTPRQSLTAADAGAPAPAPALIRQPTPIPSPSMAVATPTEQAAPLQVAEADAWQPPAVGPLAQPAKPAIAPPPDALALQQLEVVARRDPNDAPNEPGIAGAAMPPEASPETAAAAPTRPVTKAPPLKALSTESVALPRESERVSTPDAQPATLGVVSAPSAARERTPLPAATPGEQPLADTTALLATNGSVSHDVTLVADAQIVDARAAPPAMGVMPPRAAAPRSDSAMAAVALPKLEEARLGGDASAGQPERGAMVAPAESSVGVVHAPTTPTALPKVMFKTGVERGALRSGAPEIGGESLISVDSFGAAEMAPGAALVTGRGAGRVGALDAPTPALRLPTESADAPTPAPFARRAPGAKEDAVRTLGGSDRTERAVGAALGWLARHQAADGHWDAAGFDANCGECGGASDALVSRAVTGLSLLAFLGAGHTHHRDGPYREVVRRGLTWLIDQQADDGDMRGPETMYSQGIAAIALAEALAMTGDAALRAPAQSAIDFIVAACDPRGGGWRYEPGQAGDTSVTGWQVMALNSAKTAQLRVPEKAFESARQWMAGVESPDAPGHYAYRPRERATPAMTAEGMFVQLLLGADAQGSAMENGAQLLLRNLPDWSESLNTYYWYYATLALFHRGGPDWQRWNSALTRELLAAQRTKGPAAGSWEPGGEWAPIGGRIYQTAISALMLEVYYRYLPMHAGAAGVAQGSVAPTEAIGAIRGRIRDALTGEPIANARVRVDLPDALPLLGLSSADGRYEIAVPEMPDFFAMTASTPGYSPSSLNISAAELRGRSIVRDYALKPLSENVIALEEQPEVHHLGNDAWEGQINSQFQRRTEGRRFRANFSLSEAQSAARAPRVWLLVKGVQCPLHLLVNGHSLQHDFVESPADGSFGAFEIPFDPQLLREGDNVFEIRGVSCHGDLDDFEFVNPQIRLRRDAD